MIKLLQLGLGNVGSELVNQALNRRTYLNQMLGVDLAYCGLFTTHFGAYNPEGLNPDEIERFPDGSRVRPDRVITEVSGPFVVIDTTSSVDTLPLLKQALDQGGFVVTANKLPLAGSQEDYDSLFKHGRNRLFYEATVGAGLPIISTIQDLINTGDEIECMRGCFSGSLGFILSRLGSGTPFSDAVAEAQHQGFTEHDVREDLSGADVVRKVIILARLLSRRIEGAEVSTMPLFPDKMTQLSAEAFVGQLKQLDNDYSRRVNNAKKKGGVLRYVATLTPSSCSIELAEVSSSTDIGTLEGPDNMVVIQTKRYHDNPLVIKGPGAGVPVTAAAVLADVIKAAQLSTR